jgi:hypothetical protein
VAQGAYLGSVVLPAQFRGRAAVALSLLGIAVGGGIVFAFGVWLYRRPAKCEGEEMSPGDTCISQRGSREIDRRSYDEVLESQQLLGVIVAAVGCIVVLGVIVAAVTPVWNKRVAGRFDGGTATRAPRTLPVIVIGAVLLVSGPVVAALHVEPAFDPVLCDGQKMSKDDFCRATGQDYSERQGEQKLVPISLLGGGIVMFLVGLTCVVVGRRSRRTGRWG